MHDLQICDCDGHYKKLKPIFEDTGGKVFVNSSSYQGSFDYLIRSSQCNITSNGRIEAPTLHQNGLLRQSAKLRMIPLKEFQRSFPRIKDRFYYEKNG